MHNDAFLPEDTLVTRSQWTQCRRTSVVENNGVPVGLSGPHKGLVLETNLLMTYELSSTKPNSKTSIVSWMMSLLNQRDCLQAHHCLRCVRFTAPLEESMGHIVNEEELERMVVCSSEHTWASLMSQLCLSSCLSCSCYQLVKLSCYCTYSLFSDFL